MKKIRLIEADGKTALNCAPDRVQHHIDRGCRLALGEDCQDLSKEVIETLDNEAFAKANPGLVDKSERALAASRKAEEKKAAPAKAKAVSKMTAAKEEPEAKPAPTELKTEAS